MKRQCLLRRNTRNTENQLTSVKIPYIQVVRVSDFSQCENLKRGQENRGLLFSIGPRVRVVRAVRVLDLAVIKALILLQNMGKIVRIGLELM